MIRCCILSDSSSLLFLLTDAAARSLNPSESRFIVGEEDRRAATDAWIRSDTARKRAISIILSLVLPLLGLMGSLIRRLVSALSTEVISGFISRPNAVVRAGSGVITRAAVVLGTTGGTTKLESASGAGLIVKGDKLTPNPADEPNACAAVGLVAASTAEFSAL